MSMHPTMGPFYNEMKEAQAENDRLRARVAELEAREDELERELAERGRNAYLHRRLAELEPYAEEMKWVQKVLGRAFDGNETGGAKAVETLMEQRDKARADERKACARVCNVLDDTGSDTGDAAYDCGYIMGIRAVAAAIRARSD